MSQRDKIYIAIILLCLLFRGYLASISSYPHFQGWNEAHYSIIAKNYFASTLWIQNRELGHPPVYAVPPFFSYLVYLFFGVFGISEFSARLVSLLAECLTVFSVYIIARELYEKDTAILSSLIFVFIPWNMLWGGRAQTDMLLVSLITTSIALFVYAYKNEKPMLYFGISFGLALFTKQPALGILGIILVWGYIKKEIRVASKAFPFMLAGSLPFLIWAGYNVLREPVPFFNQFIYENVFIRSPAFSNLGGVISEGFIVGISPIILLLSLFEIIKIRQKGNILIIWLVIYGIYVFVKTPVAHEYYVLLLTPPIAILSARGILRLSSNLGGKNLGTLLVATTVLSTMPFTYTVFAYSGEFGYTCTRDVGNYLADYMNGHTGESYLIMTPNGLTPQIVWYANLTSPGYSNKQIYSIFDDPNELSILYLKRIVNNSNATKIFLVIDDRGTLEKELASHYPLMYISNYSARTIRGEYKEHLAVYKLKEGKNEIPLDRG